MKKPAVIVIALILTLLNTLRAGADSQDAIYIQLIGPESGAVGALDAVLKSPDVSPALVLFAASAVALREKRVEDSAFLYYIAKLRLTLDRALFPPIGKNTDDPMLVLLPLREELGHRINPAIMAQPKLFAAAIARMKSWNPAVPEGYNPAWVWSKTGDMKASMEMFSKTKASVSKELDNLCALLQDDAYFAAFKICQDYNFKPAPAKPTKQAYDTALLTLKKIEKQKGIPGFAAALGK